MTQRTGEGGKGTEGEKEEKEREIEGAERGVEGPGRRRRPQRSFKIRGNAIALKTPSGRLPFFFS